MGVTVLSVADGVISFFLTGVGGLFVTATLVVALGVLFLFDADTVTPETQFVSDRAFRLTLLVSSAVCGIVFSSIVVVRSLAAI